jgi:hypothetical protein
MNSNLGELRKTENIFGEFSNFRENLLSSIDDRLKAGSHLRSNSR